MNYRHIYHAGNFADVTKHIILTLLITALTRKSTPFCYIDTHAGIGYYDLFSEFASKKKEYQNGIEKIIQAENPPPAVKQYIRAVHQINNQLTGAKFASLRFYPGSPMIVRSLIRANDRIIVSELHPEDYQTLKNTFAHDKAVSCHHLDGFLSLKAFLPPREKRGLVLIDPPYENPSEFSHILHALSSAMKRWKNGIYAIWYPIKESKEVARFHQSLQEMIDLPILGVELTIYPDLPQHLNGCGLVIINPPYQFDEDVDKILPWLWKSLTINQQGRYRSFRLK